MSRRSLRAEEVDPFSLAIDEVGLIVAAAGYEPRCTAMVAGLRAAWRCAAVDLGRKLLLLRFTAQADLPTRVAADAEFAEYEPNATLAVDKDSAHAVHRKVAQLAKGMPRGSTILVDYSCMSRLLYLSLVSLVYDGFKIVFGYSLGSYTGFELDYPIAAVGAIKPVPGLEGIHYHSRPTLHVIGLGYDGVGTRALVNRLEASRLVVFWAEPGSSATAGAVAREQNQSVISEALVTFSRDVRDVTGTVAVLSRLAFEVAGSDRVVFLPVGPKPHVLACAIAAAPFEHCSVLAPYLGAGGIRDRFPLVAAAGEYIGTRVTVSLGIDDVHRGPNPS